jgi:hypothetical protein
MPVLRNILVAFLLTAATGAGADWKDSCPGVEQSTVKPQGKDKDLTKAQCRRVVSGYKAFVDIISRKTKTANFSAGGASCVSYCYDLYPDIKIPIP